MAEETGSKKVLFGTVVSNKMDKTIVVSVEKRMKHKLYGKFITRTKKYKAHDVNNECQEGDYVKIIEHRPLSKHKKWKYVETLKKAVQL